MKIPACASFGRISRFQQSYWRESSGRSAFSIATSCSEGVIPSGGAFKTP